MAEKHSPKLLWELDLACKVSGWFISSKSAAKAVVRENFLAIPRM